MDSFPFKWGRHLERVLAPDGFHIAWLGVRVYLFGLCPVVSLLPS